jgi:hypothetical protein
LKRENLKSVIAVIGKPKLLLKQLTAQENKGANADYDSVRFGIMLFRNCQANHNTCYDHNHKRKNMKPTKHTGAYIAIIDIAPRPIDKF